MTPSWPERKSTLRLLSQAGCLIALFHVAPSAYAEPAGVLEIPSATPIRVQGRPFFPVGLYSYPKHAPDRDIYKGMAEAGFNYCLLSASTTKQDLDAAHQNGLRVMIVVGDLLNLSGTAEQIAAKMKSLAQQIGPDSAAFKHPAVVALEGPDEPLWSLKYYGAQSKAAVPEMATWARPPEARQEIYALLHGLRDGYAEIHRLCGDRYLVWINFAPRGDEDELRWFTELPCVGGFPQDGRTTADVFGTDVYPVPGGGGSNGWIRGRIVASDACVGAFAEKLRRAVHPHPCYMVLQGCGTEEWDPEAVKAGRAKRRPTFEEQQFITFDAIVHGANGILIWGALFVEDDSAYWKDVGRVNRAVRALGPALAEGSDWPDVLPGMQEVSVLGRLWHGERIVVATNNNPGARAPGLIAIPGWNGAKARSLLDGRDVPVADGVLRDDPIPPLGVRVYTDGTSLPKAFAQLK